MCLTVLRSLQRESRKQERPVCKGMLKGQEACTVKQSQGSLWSGLMRLNAHGVNGSTLNPVTSLGSLASVMFAFYLAWQNFECTTLCGCDTSNTASISQSAHFLAWYVPVMLAGVERGCKP